VGQLPDVSGFIAYDTANSGGFLDLATTGQDGDGYGIHIIEGDLTSFGVLVETLGGQIQLSSKTDILLFTTQGNGGSIKLLSDGSIEFNLGSGATFTLLDSSANPMLQMTDGSPDLHIQTGGVVVADL